MGGPSDRAIDAMARAAYQLGWGYNEHNARSAAEKIAPALHDPALGLDRSVRLGDVVDAIRAEESDPGGAYVDADWVAERFTEATGG